VEPRFAPVDLNALLYNTERTIAALLRVRNGTGDRAMAERHEQAATRRRSALQAHAYDAREGFFFDVRWTTGKRVTDRPTLAASAALYFGVATDEQGKAVAARLERDFLKAGGFATTLISSGQQWDAPKAGRRCSGCRWKGSGATGAPTWPTPRATAGSPSTGAPTRRPGR
jgi:alpha,alpha-trehalase